LRRRRRRPHRECRRKASQGGCYGSSEVEIVAPARSYEAVFAGNGAGAPEERFSMGDEPMKFGRPPVGLGHVDRLEGPEDLKERLHVVLATVTGEMTVEEACAALGVGPSRLHVMRRQALEGALTALAPGRAGRPRAEPDAAAEREKLLEQKIDDLEVDLQAAL